jgi:S-adenosylmethionine hydrolase
MSSIGPSARRITLLTDFGTRDGYTGAMRGVIAGIAPDAIVEDISHDVPRGDVHAAAWTLATYAHLYPPGTVHVAVIDPGVGSERRAIAARVGSHIFVAPDNGSLTRVLDGEAEVVEIRERVYRRDSVSQTFHGRDIFAPAAAHLARGIALDQLGPRAVGVIRLDYPQAVRTSDGIIGEVIHVDRFGNLITNIPGAWIAQSTEGRWELRTDTAAAPVVSTYADVPAGDLLAYEGSSKMMEIGTRDGNAAAQTGLHRGARITAGSAV